MPATHYCRHIQEFSLLREVGCIITLARPLSKKILCPCATPLLPPLPPPPFSPYRFVWPVNWALAGGAVRPCIKALAWWGQNNPLLSHLTCACQEGARSSRDPSSPGSQPRHCLQAGPIHILFACSLKAAFNVVACIATRAAVLLIRLQIKATADRARAALDCFAIRNCFAIRVQSCNLKECRHGLILLAAFSHNCSPDANRSAALLSKLTYLPGHTPTFPEEI